MAQHLVQAPSGRPVPRNGVGVGAGKLYSVIHFYSVGNGAHSLVYSKQAFCHWEVLSRCSSTEP